MLVSCLAYSPTREDTLFRNVGWLSVDYMKLYPRIQNSPYSRSGFRINFATLSVSHILLAYNDRRSWGNGHGLIYGTIPASAWINWGKPWNPPFTIIDVSADIQNTRQKHYRSNQRALTTIIIIIIIIICGRYSPWWTLASVLQFLNQTVSQ
jgi:hypothetical protein